MRSGTEDVRSSGEDRKWPAVGRNDAFDPNRTWPNSTRTCLLVTSHNFRRFLGTCHRYRCSVIAEVRKRPTSPVPNECVDLKQVNGRNVSSRSSFWFVNSNLEKSHGYGSRR